MMFRSRDQEGKIINYIEVRRQRLVVQSRQIVFDNNRPLYMRIRWVTSLSINAYKISGIEKFSVGTRMTDACGRSEDNSSDSGSSVSTPHDELLAHRFHPLDCKARSA